jgi:cytochrome b
MIQKRSVWDLPTRIFHWGLAVSVFLSMLIVYGKKYLALHLVSGIVAFSLVLGRIVWGFTGTKYVRFGAFLKGFSEAKKEFSLIKEDADHTVGHPAVAGWVMLLLIASAFGVGISGIWLLEFAAKEQKEIALQVHEAFANTVLAIAFIHLQGVMLHIFLHSDGIVKGMIDGKRPAKKGEEIGSLNISQKIIAFIWLGGSFAAGYLYLNH